MECECGEKLIRHGGDTVCPNGCTENPDWGVTLGAEGVRTSNTPLTAKEDEI